MLKITENAATLLSQARASAGVPDTFGVRFFLGSKDPDGPTDESPKQITFKFVPTPEPADDVVTKEKVPVYVAPDAEPTLSAAEREMVGRHLDKIFQPVLRETALRGGGRLKVAYERVRRPGVETVARATLTRPVTEALAAGTLYDYAAHHPDARPPRRPQAPNLRPRRTFRHSNADIIARPRKRCQPGPRGKSTTLDVIRQMLVRQ